MVTACAAETAASKPSSLQQDVDALVTGGAPGAILLVRDGNRTSHYAGGFADVARKRPMRARDHFKIACLTKSYTATVVLQLVAEGELHLTDTVERWLPGLVPNGGKITIRELLNHTSGIPEYETDARYLKPYLSGNFAYYWPPRKMVALAVSHKPLFPPGKTRISAYSNTNYVIAGLIVEAVTGHTIGAELNRRIFRPLHLRDTSYPTKPGLPSPYTHGYMVVGKPPAVDVSGLSPSLSPASGAIVSTADDVADFYRALFCRTSAPIRPVEGDEDNHPGGTLGRHSRPVLRPRPRAIPDLMRQRLGPQRRHPRLCHVHLLERQRNAPSPADGEPRLKLAPESRFQALHQSPRHRLLPHREPSTPSLPWRFRGVTRVHARSLATQFFLQTDWIGTAEYASQDVARVQSDVSVLCPRAVAV
jgi:CubicO group peptidase (beta-lactamase class C family)